MIPFFFYLLLFEDLPLTEGASLGYLYISLAFQTRPKASDDSVLTLTPQMAYLVLSLRPQPAAET